MKQYISGFLCSAGTCVRVHADGLTGVALWTPQGGGATKGDVLLAADALSLVAGLVEGGNHAH